ncbi:NitT/TauT family transport system substrate-binding protein [Haloactinopolyspora alba]|uniref:NitT/TauT family transport system substrate-binding protein n=1 Tax=Haloactinopolyspora alba TaxID=648780 RepID=A0A2P8DV41_9ACTN|nr:ABC transporter substrate-binding protein [Haloactinopolyspora alba]PSL01075.1 NitT/TauT family transport system substrate-binding protein [Haloactinopolyspora alba]
MRRSLLTTSVVALFILAACGSGETTTSGDGDGPTEVTLTLNWVPYGEHAPFYYGVAEGIYEEEGIDLEIKPGSGSTTTVQQVAQSQTEFGWADTPALLNGVSEGMPVKSVGVFLQKGPSSVEFFAEQGVSEPADLAGLTVAGTPGDAMYATFPAWLELNGVNPEDVNVVNVDPAGKIAALVEGRADAIMGFFHDQAPTIENISGNPVEVLQFSDWGMNLLGTGIVVHQKTIDENPELVESFVRATARSWEAAAENQEAAAAAMEEAASETPETQVLVDQLDKSLGLLQLDTAPAPGVNTEEQWQETIDLLAEHADLKDPGDPSTYWDPSFAEAG